MTEKLHNDAYQQYLAQLKEDLAHHRRMVLAPMLLIVAASTATAILWLAPMLFGEIHQSVTTVGVLVAVLTALLLDLWLTGSHYRPMSEEAFAAQEHMRGQLLRARGQRELDRQP